MNIFIYYYLAVNYFQKHKITTKNMITITKITDNNNNSTNILKNTTLSTNDLLKSLLHIDPIFQF